MSLKTAATSKQSPLTSVLLVGMVLLVAGPAFAQNELVITEGDTLQLATEDVDLSEPNLSEPNLSEPNLSEPNLPEPNAQAIEIEPVDLWDTGVSPTAAVVMTPLFPGWGQLYARNSWQAALGFGSEMYFWSNMLVRDRRAVRANDFGESLPVGDPTRDRYRAIADENWEQMRDFAWWSGGVLLIIALDAYVGAHLFNFDEDPVPVPDRWDDTFGRVGDNMPGTSDGPSLVVFQWRKAF